MFDPEKELKDFCDRWDAAMIKNDAQEISAFMSDDWVIVGTDGGITSKASFLSGINSGVLTHDRMDADEVRIKIYDNTGVVTTKGTSAGKYNDQPFSFYEWSTSIFIKSDDQWHCVLTMLTPVNSKT